MSWFNIKIWVDKPGGFEIPPGRDMNRIEQAIDKLAGWVPEIAILASDATIAATASKVAKRDTNANLLADNFLASGMVTTQSAGSTILTSGSAFAQFFPGSTGHTVLLPSAGVGVNHGHLIINTGIGNLSLRTSDNSGVGTLLTGQSVWAVANQDAPTSPPHWSYAWFYNQPARVAAQTSSTVLRDANGLTRIVALTTSSRPSATTAGSGASYFDTTLSKPIWSDGSNWRDSSGTIV